MSAALAALKRIPAALASARSGRDDKNQSSPPGPEPGPLPRAAKTGGCRLPELAMIAEAYQYHKNDKAYMGRHEVERVLSTKLAADLERPFGQSTGRGFSFTRFRMEHHYSTVIMRQQDVFAPWIDPKHKISLRTLHEVGHLVSHADPICGHLRWEEEYPFLVPNLANLGLHQRSTEDETVVAPLMARETANMHPRLRCALLHEPGCLCRDSIAFGTLKYCPRCHTDFAVDMVPDSAQGCTSSSAKGAKGRLLVFTTWKYLGNGSSNECYFWRSHQTSAKPERFYRAAHIYGGFVNEENYKIDVAELQQCIASVLKSQRGLPPKYTDVADHQQYNASVRKSQRGPPPKYTAVTESSTRGY